MLLTLDMGNTNITLGVFQNTELLFESRIATDPSKMEDQYAVELLDIFRLYGVDAGSFEGAILSSVVPPLDQTLHGAVRKATGVMAMQVGPGTRTGMNILIDNPATLGADLLVGAVAAVKKYGAPCLIWDLGTATKVSVVDKSGAFRAAPSCRVWPLPSTPWLQKPLCSPHPASGPAENGWLQHHRLHGVRHRVRDCRHGRGDDRPHRGRTRLSGHRRGHRRPRPGGLRPLPAGDPPERYPSARRSADHLREKPEVRLNPSSSILFSSLSPDCGLSARTDGETAGGTRRTRLSYPAAEGNGVYIHNRRCILKRNSS